MAESSEPIAVTLTEDDIPGAKLFEPWERHTNHLLRWLLLCHGIQVPVSLTKAKLIEGSLQNHVGLQIVL